jgi:hypothetical protein
MAEMDWPEACSGKCQMGWSIFSPVDQSKLEILSRIIIIWLIMGTSRNKASGEVHLRYKEAH